MTLRSALLAGSLPTLTWGTEPVSLRVEADEMDDRMLANAAHCKYEQNRYPDGFGALKTASINTPINCGLRRYLRYPQTMCVKKDGKMRAMFRDEKGNKIYIDPAEACSLFSSLAEYKKSLNISTTTTTTTMTTTTTTTTTTDPPKYLQITLWDLRGTDFMGADWKTAPDPYVAIEARDADGNTIATEDTEKCQHRTTAKTNVFEADWGDEKVCLKLDSTKANTSSIYVKVMDADGFFNGPDDDMFESKLETDLIASDKNFKRKIEGKYYETVKKRIKDNYGKRYEKRTSVYLAKLNFVFRIEAV